MMRLRSSTIAVLCALAAMLAWGGPAEAKDPTGKFVTVIDPAHGGKDEGVQLTRRVLEKDVTLAIATLVKRNLDDAKNLTVRFTRMGDTDVAMADRVGTAIKAQADLFISLHVNAGFEKEAAGYELYFPGFGGQEAARGTSRGESAAIVRDMVRTKHLNEGVRFAQILQKRLDPVFPRMDRGLREAPVLILQNLSIPAVVLEIGFSTNPGDRKKLQEESVQAAVAKAIAESIREFFQ
ncbi:MAG: N-acetylmuramoyl-L-alanine amidase [Syntrophaceae bacterium]|nr:N-acetylmuramoyl-L-alanine amidase [Syntrophaceae bacterium]